MIQISNTDDTNPTNTYLRFICTTNYIESGSKSCAKEGG